MCLRVESNHNFRLRRPASYPLNDEGKKCAPGGTRTLDPDFIRVVLSPAELLARRCRTALAYRQAGTTYHVLRVYRPNHIKYSTINQGAVCSGQKAKSMLY